MNWLKVYVAPENEPICDFCSAAPVYKAYTAHDFLVEKNEKLVRESKGGWAACEACANLIDKENWAGLLHRSLCKFAENHDLPYEIVSAMLRSDLKRMHELFREHRIKES